MPARIPSLGKRNHKTLFLQVEMEIPARVQSGCREEHKFLFFLLSDGKAILGTVSGQRRSQGPVF